MGFKTQRTLAFVGVVKGNRHGGLGDTTLSIFVNQVLEVGGSHLKVKVKQRHECCYKLCVVFANVSEELVLLTFPPLQYHTAH